MNKDKRLYFAWLVAIVATISSLYLSEIKHYQPCILCWYQRIAMYPQVLLLGIAAFTSDYGVRKYAIPLSLVGLVVSLIQNAEDWGIIPVLKSCSIENGAVPCNTPWPLWSDTFSPALAPLDPIFTIPVMSMIAFIFIIALLSWKK